MTKTKVTREELKELTESMFRKVVEAGAGSQFMTFVRKDAKEEGVKIGAIIGFIVGFAIATIGAILIAI